MPAVWLLCAVFGVVSSRDVELVLSDVDFSTLWRLVPLPVSDSCLSARVPRAPSFESALTEHERPESRWRLVPPVAIGEEGFGSVTSEAVVVDVAASGDDSGGMDAVEAAGDEGWQVKYSEAGALPSLDIVSDAGNPSL